MTIPVPNQWQDAAPCAAESEGPSTGTVDNIILTGVPASVSTAPPYWSVVLNDATPEVNFRVDRFDDSGAFVDSVILADRSDGYTWIAGAGLDVAAGSFVVDGATGQVTVAADPADPLGVATKQYVDANAGGIPEAPMDQRPYARDMGTWQPIPTIIPDAPATSQRYGRFNSVWQLDAIQTDAPNDGAAYVRQSQGWTPALTGGPYMPTSGGTFTGPVTLPPNNSVVIGGPVNQLKNILTQTAGIARWQLNIGDSSTEGLNNVGCNFTLMAYSTTGAYLGTWLTIARADGTTNFNGGAVNIAGSLAVNGLVVLAGPANLAMYGGTAGQFLQTNGSGVLSWATAAAAGVASIDFSPTGLTPGPGATGAVTVGGVLNVANGGMGGATHVLNGVLIGAGANAIKASAAAPGAGALLIGAVAAVPTWLAVGSAGNLLTIASGTPAWAAPAAAGVLPLTGGTLTGALTPSSTAGIVGTTTNDNANAGSVGEVISSVVLSPGVTLTTLAGSAVTSISLTAGDWDVCGEVWISAGTGAPTAVYAGINSSAGLPAAPAMGESRTQFTGTLAASNVQVLSLHACRISLAATTTYYLVGRCDFPSGTTTAYGAIWARRAR